MAFGGRTGREVLELENIIEEFEEEHGNNEFTEGALAVIKWVTQGTPATAEDFMKEYDLTGEYGK